METMPLIYIASPFFDEYSKEFVSIKENDFKGTKTSYFSPREDGLNFHEVKDVNLRSARIRAIFKNNVKNLDLCKHLCINLYPVNGRTDIGTLWELGYFIAKHGDPKFDTDEFSAINAPEGMKSMVKVWIKNLTEFEVPEILGKKNKVLLVSNLPVKRAEKTFELTDMNYDVFGVPGDLKLNPEMFTENTLLLTDDFPDCMFVLAGWMYAKKLPYYTASFKDYGSNIMMAASSGGHLKFPGLVDDTFRTDLI